MTKGYGISGKRAALFLWHWLLSGFFLGTLTLAGPVRWATGYTRGAGWSYGAEKLVVLGLIGGLAAVSLLLALALTRSTEAAAGRRRYALPAVSLGLFLLALALWLNPRLMNGTAAAGPAESFSWSEFVFGPYPEKERLAELKAEGYTAVISLLSKAVVPFEPVLLAREQEAAKETGLELIHIPMLPWVSSNDHVGARLKELARRGPGKYYVHCYLGKDRVNVFKRMLAAAPGAAAVRDLDPSAARSLKGVKAFERGPVAELERDVYLTPYPTDEEFFGYVLNGTVAGLVSLLDPANPENLPWIKKEEAIARKYGLPLSAYPWLALDKAGKQKAVREIRAARRPVVVHAFLSKAPECADFAAFYSAAKAK